MAVPFLDQYESVDVIGNGSFGIIRKVRRKSDGQIFARKELDFGKMTERDRKQIVAEVNILKDLHHDHIVRYHDRYVDRDAGMLYILMEYCGGGDLSTIIKQAQRHGRPIPEDTIWNYFMQILLALQHCHHPNGHGRNGSTGSASLETGGSERRTQILHRDIKPDNVFLDENNKVKLGDFGLSKALSTQASFANTYVGTPYYMSPELMQEKAYDTKSDIWSLGCLMYELCALRPPFHEARTHAELSILIRNGRIPPLPKGYSQALGAIIKSMLNLNPAMRPSATTLLQNERLELVLKVSDTEKMLATVKAHKAAVVAREREVLARENKLHEREQHISAAVSQKDAEISSLQHTLGQYQQHYKYSQQDVENAIREAIERREEELRVLVHQREEEVAAAMAKREEEIIGSVNKREAELNEAWVTREQQIRAEVEEQVQWIHSREEELDQEEQRLEDLKLELEEKAQKAVKGRKEKNPLEEVQNVLEPHSNCTPRAQAKPRSPSPFPAIRTPAAVRPLFTPASAMKGVILTATGEALTTPAPADLAKLFVESPKVGLDFTKIFDLGSRKPCSEQDLDDLESSADEAESPPPSPSRRKERTRSRGNASESEKESSTSGTEPSSSRDRKQSLSSGSAPPTRLRRPSIRGSLRRGASSGTLPSSVSDSAATLAPSPVISSQQTLPKPLPHPHLHSNNTAPLPNVRSGGSSSSSSGTARTMQRTMSAPIADYDLADEENLPSPFIKRTERATSMGAAKSMGKRASGNFLRTVAAVNATVRRKNSLSNAGGDAMVLGTPVGGARPSVASARKASEEARQVLLRQS
ncbi:hypothetical protein D9758_008178 [Tetrapyrgos nigripes]|uniref:non-specific serine/threonine protein kinase n=1 Tax=Tetrapyrgos nigripes TaxID=182062 RepID=A0A8H5LPS2_9AGAR|nr:hypothetical protein D9758_008178 [Tetrapyrgos nigripes]